MKKILLLLLMLPVFLFTQQGKNDPVLNAMLTESQRAMKELKSNDGLKPYFIAYTIDENSIYNISATHGVLQNSSYSKARYLDVDLRVGSPKLDNTHRIKERMLMLMPPPPTDISINNDKDAIRYTLWQETESSFREAIEKYPKVLASNSLNVSQSDTSNDFSKEVPTVYYENVPEPKVDVAYWESFVKEISKLFNDNPLITDSYVMISFNTSSKYFASSEGSNLKHGRTFIRISIKGSLLAEDGMELSKYYAFDAGNETELPNKEVIEKEAKKVIDQLLKLKDAPITEPYVGPAILTGKASAVFFHEIFGHRVEGHRQKNDEESQTFTKQVNQPVLPEFLSVYDDPTLEKYNGSTLNGYYKYDDEGIKSQKVTIVENGKLKGFLMGRSPVQGFPTSNGHGRKSPGNHAVSRQGNLFVKSTKSYSFEDLKKKLLEECVKQNKPFGLLFDDNEGGFTNTGRRSVNAFKVIPVIVYKIFTDGRPDELIRGVDLIGTPLTCFSKIIATSDKTTVFSGFCGAESGFVPVTAISPDILVSEIEIQKKEKGSDKPPVLPPPSKLLSK
jgi:TldD protein